MIAPRLRSEARSGSASTSSSRYGNNSTFYGAKISHSHDSDLKRALQHSYVSQTVRKWEKRWVTIHETSMRVHKWMPISGSNRTLPPKNSSNSSVINPNDTSVPSQDTQMIIDEESISQSSQN